VVSDEDRIDYLVDFYSKSNRLSISIFTVVVIGIVAEPYPQLGGRDPPRTWATRLPPRVQYPNPWSHTSSHVEEWGERIPLRAEGTLVSWDPSHPQVAFTRVNHHTGVSRRTLPLHLMGEL
jgi:hypothetical protein